MEKLFHFPSFTSKENRMLGIASNPDAQSQPPKLESIEPPAEATRDGKDKVVQPPEVKLPTDLPATVEGFKKSVGRDADGRTAKEVRRNAKKLKAMKNAPQTAQEGVPDAENQGNKGKGGEQMRKTQDGGTESVNSAIARRNAKKVNTGRTFRAGDALSKKTNDAKPVDNNNDGYGPGYPDFAKEQGKIPDNNNDGYGPGYPDFAKEQGKTEPKAKKETAEKTVDMEAIKSRVRDGISQAIVEIEVEGGTAESAQKFLDQANDALSDIPTTGQKSTDKNAVTSVIKEALGGKLTKNVGPDLQLIGTGGSIRIQKIAAKAGEKAAKEQASAAPNNIETFNSKFDDLRDAVSSRVINAKGTKDPSVTQAVNAMNDLIRASKSKGVAVESKVQSMDGVKITDKDGVTWGRYDYDQETGGLDVFAPKPGDNPEPKKPDAPKGNEAQESIMNKLKEATDKAKADVAIAEEELTELNNGKEGADKVIKAIDAYLKAGGAEVSALEPDETAQGRIRSSEVRADMDAMEARKSELQKEYPDTVVRAEVPTDTTPTTPDRRVGRGRERARGKATESSEAGTGAPRESNEAKESIEKNFEKQKKYEMLEREHDKLADASAEEWGVLPEHGKADRNGQPFIYRRVDQVDDKGKIESKTLYAYSPTTGYQVMDSETGMWTILGAANEDMKAAGIDNGAAEHGKILADAEKNDPDAYKKLTEEQVRNFNMENYLKYEAKPGSEGFDRNSDQWNTPQNKDVCRRLAAILDGKMTNEQAEADVAAVKAAVEGAAAGKGTGKTPEAAPAGKTNVPNATPDGKGKTPETTTAGKEVTPEDFEKQKAELKKALDKIAEANPDLKPLCELIKTFIDTMKAPADAAKKPEAGADGKGTETAPAKPAESKEAGKNRLEGEIKKLKEDLAQVDKDYSDTVKKGYDELHKDNDAGFKKLDDLAAKGKQIEADIAKKEAELKALSESKEVTDEKNVDKLIASRKELTDQLPKLTDRKDAEKLKQVKTDIEAIDKKLGDIRTDLKKEVEKLTDRKDADKLNKAKEDIAKIDAVLGAEKVDASKDTIDTKEALSAVRDGLKDAKNAYVYEKGGKVFVGFMDTATGKSPANEKELTQAVADTLKTETFKDVTVQHTQDATEDKHTVNFSGKGLAEKETTGKIKDALAKTVSKINDLQKAPADKPNDMPAEFKTVAEALKTKGVTVEMKGDDVVLTGKDAATIAVLDNVRAATNAFPLNIALGDVMSKNTDNTFTLKGTNTAKGTILNTIDLQLGAKPAEKPAEDPNEKKLNGLKKATDEAITDVERSLKEDDSSQQMSALENVVKALKAEDAEHAAQGSSDSGRMSEVTANIDKYGKLLDAAKKALEPSESEKLKKASEQTVAAAEKALTEPNITNRIKALETAIAALRAEQTATGNSGDTGRNSEVTVTLDKFEATLKDIKDLDAAGARLTDVLGLTVTVEADKTTVEFGSKDARNDAIMQLDPGGEFKDTIKEDGDNKIILTGDNKKIIQDLKILGA